MSNTSLGMKQDNRTHNTQTLSEKRAKIVFLGIKQLVTETEPSSQDICLATFTYTKL